MTWNKGWGRGEMVEHGGEVGKRISMCIYLLFVCCCFKTYVFVVVLLIF